MNEIEKVLDALDHLANSEAFQNNCKIWLDENGSKPFVNTRDQTYFKTYPSLRTYFNVLTDSMVDSFTMNDLTPEEGAISNDTVFDLILNPTVVDQFRARGYTIIEKDDCYYVECGYAIV